MDRRTSTSIYASLPPTSSASFSEHGHGLAAYSFPAPSSAHTYDDPENAYEYHNLACIPTSAPAPLHLSEHDTSNLASQPRSMSIVSVEAGYEYLEQQYSALGRAVRSHEAGGVQRALEASVQHPAFIRSECQDRSYGSRQFQYDPLHSAEPTPSPVSPVAAFTSQPHYSPYRMATSPMYPAYERPMSLPPHQHQYLQQQQQQYHDPPYSPYDMSRSASAATFSDSETAYRFGTYDTASSSSSLPPSAHPAEDIEHDHNYAPPPPSSASSAGPSRNIPSYGHAYSDRPLPTRASSTPMPVSSSTSTSATANVPASTSPKAKPKPRRAQTSRLANPALFHPSPALLLAPGALPAAGGRLAHYPDSDSLWCADPGKLTEEDYARLPTKRSRGRKPLSAQSVDSLSSTGEMHAGGGEEEEHAAAVAYAGVTKTGKAKKVWKCKVPECHKLFKRSEHLKRHVRSIHTDERPFQCKWPQCGRFFSRHDNLSQHLRVHRTPAMSDQDFSAMLEFCFTGGVSSAGGDGGGGAGADSKLPPAPTSSDSSSIEPEAPDANANATLTGIGHDWPQVEALTEAMASAMATAGAGDGVGVAGAENDFGRLYETHLPLRPPPHLRDQQHESAFTP